MIHLFDTENTKKMNNIKLSIFFCVSPLSARFLPGIHHSLNIVKIFGWVHRIASDIEAKIPEDLIIIFIQHDR